MKESDLQTLLPADATWAGAMLLIVGGLFLAALVVGLISRSMAPQAYDDTGPQDEPE